LVVFVGPPLVNLDGSPSRAEWAEDVVLDPPGFDYPLGLEQVGELLDVEQLDSDAAVERLTKGFCPVRASSTTRPVIAAVIWAEAATRWARRSKW
jgi:hypothetical protein